MKHIVGCSFGKDSLAMVIKMREAGMPIDEILYCRIMFNDTISAEYPIHEKWIHEVAIPKLESWGLKVTIVQSEKNILRLLLSKISKRQTNRRSVWFSVTDRRMV
jgi:3'-phosphoadenosine 5'-phosphosulfate sulfotransferase (PAPS reductase)/FAD synthetase